jgi:glycosyltransferase involved in cell wall biosynthesis
MTVHFFTFSNAKGGSSRQRAFRVAEELHVRGIMTEIHWPPVVLMSRTPWPKKFLLLIATIRSLFSIKKEDIVYLQRTISNKYFFVIMVVYLYVFRRKMIFDFDDPVYVHSFFKTKTFTRMADTVIVCTHGQAEWAKKFNPNIHIAHISVDFPVFKRFTKDYGKIQNPLVIGWVGTGPEHIYNLQILASVFRKLVTRTTTPFKFVLIGALKNKQVYELFQQIPALKVEFIDTLDWANPESVPREIQKFDIGVLPHRSDGEWNESKTSLKNLEYMACGVVAICSSFGEMPYVIQDGVNGYLASTEEEWVEKLSRLLSDKELRITLGRAGQERVRTEYCYDVLIPKYEGIIASLTPSELR